MMWLDKHRPQEKAIPPETQRRLDEGNAFGDEMMGMFGSYVEVTAFRPDGRLDFSAMLKKTRECIEEEVANICEASFSYYNHFCSVDLLRRAEDGYEIYEIKNSLELREEFIKDVGFQRYIVEKCGIKVVRTFVVCRSVSPYSVTDVTPAAREFAKEVSERIWQLNKIKKQADEPIASMGEHCDFPYECWYKDYCRRSAFSAQALSDGE